MMASYYRVAILKDYLEAKKARSIEYWWIYNVYD